MKFRLAFAAVWLLPLAIFFPLRVQYYKDWTNNVWMIGYFGEFFRRHFSFPVVVNALGVTGLPYPVFYGPLFYPFAGILSVVPGSNVAMRILILLVNGIELALVFRLASALVPKKTQALALSLLTTWSVYSMTNLYNRGNITEYCGVALLVSIVCVWLSVCLDRDEKSVRYRLWIFFFLFTALVGTHTITATFGSLFLAVLVAVTVVSFKLKLAPLSKKAIPGVVFFLVVSFPWLYVIWKYKNELAAYSFQRSYWPDSIDAFTTRLSLLPWDRRVEAAPLNEISTPYLDTQINLPLVVFFFGLLGAQFRDFARSKLKYVVYGSAALGISLILLSVTPEAWAIVPKFFDHLEFTYRIISYIDLVFFTGVIFALAAVRDRPIFASKILKTITAVCLAWAGLNMVVKFQHAKAVSREFYVLGSVLHHRENLLLVPGTFYWHPNYDIGTGHAGSVQDFNLPLNPVQFPPGTENTFGFAMPADFRASPPAFLVTDVRAFPWNEFKLNDVPVKDTYLVPRDPVGFTLAVKTEVPAGRLEYVVNPDMLWVYSRNLSLIVFFGGMFFTCAWVTKRSFARFFSEPNPKA